MMPNGDPLDEFLAQQDAAELAEWEKHIDHRHELRRRRRPGPARDRASIVAELEAGSDELEALDNAVKIQHDVSIP